MRVQTAGGPWLEAELHGPATGAPLLLVMGLGMQLVAWPDGFVEQLVARGFRVVRFDNRDVGRSERWTLAGMPHLGWQGLKRALHLPVRAAYGLPDMAEDARGLLDALGIASAHVCGISMGGMIAQHLAAAHPERVRSLTLLMSSSGARHLPGATPAALAALLSRPSEPGLEALVEHQIGVFRAIGSPAYPTPDAEWRAMLEAAARRGQPDDAAGVARQLAAILADADRTPLLARLAVPTEVLHGTADPLLRPRCGEQLAEAIPAARLELVEGLGHDWPRALWPRFADAIERAARRAGPAQPG